MPFDTFLGIENDDPTIVRSSVRDMVRAIVEVGASETEEINCSRTLYRLAMFEKNRQAMLREGQFVTVLMRLLRSTNTEVVNYAIGGATYFAQDGGSSVAALMDCGLPQRALELLSQCSNLIVQTEVVGLIYHLAQEKSAKQFLIENRTVPILQDLSRTSISANNDGKDILLLSRFITHALNSLNSRSHNRSELAELVRQDPHVGKNVISEHPSTGPLSNIPSLYRDLHIATYVTPGKMAMPEDTHPKVAAKDADPFKVVSAASKWARSGRGDSVATVFKLTLPLGITKAGSIDRVVVSGNVNPDLGDWDISRCLTLRRDERTEGVWVSQKVPVKRWQKEIEYKYGLYRSDGSFMWEEGDIRRKRVEEDVQDLNFDDSWQRGAVVEEPVVEDTSASPDSDRKRFSRGARPNFREAYAKKK